MALESKIEWTDATANSHWGCDRVHAGCDHCYAESLAKRYGHKVWGKTVPRKIIKSFWGDLDKLQRKAREQNKKTKVFVGSMMDIFEKPHPLIAFNGSRIVDNGTRVTTGDLRKRLFDNILNGLYPDLIFLFLTKRPSNINKYIPQTWLDAPPENVMFGTSPVDQPTFNNLTKQLLKVKGRLFLSIEPQLAEIDLGQLVGIDWIIQGGESGPKRRPFQLAWADKMREQCKQLGIPYFFKQIDKVQPIPPQYQSQAFPEFMKGAA